MTSVLIDMKGISMNIDITNYRGRFGYYPCDYELFQKLKRLHRWYWQTVYDFHRWHRWWRKEPQNRHGAEPQYCSLFVDDTTWRKPVEHHGVRGYQVYPKMVVDRGVLALYHQARMPQVEPVPPLEGETVKTILELYTKACSYFER